MKNIKFSLGIIGIIIGVIWYIYSRTIDPSYIFEKILQYVCYTQGSIFLVGGIILLKLQNISNIIEEINDNKEFIPTHKVKLLTGADGLSLRKSQYASINPFTKIPDGIEVRLLKTGDKVNLNDQKGYWYEIITKEKIRGWCFSGSVEKI
jgi:hypothetical protein